MSDVLKQNAELAAKFKELLMLRHEPVAVKLVKEGEAYPEGYSAPEKQLSHCQAVMSAKNGSKLKMALESQGCMVGASCLGMAETNPNVASGEFHAGMGLHKGPAGAKEMIAQRIDIPYKTVGEVVCPLKDASFAPDVVVFVDIPERLYWFESMYTYVDGGRVQYSTAPFQCACEDVVAVPIVTGKPNISMGCFGCRKKTDIKPDEMAIGVPYGLIPGMGDILDVYKTGVFTKAKRD